MTRLALSRGLAFLLALLGGLTVPGAAVVHGYAHEHAAHEHADSYSRVDANSRAASVAGGPVVSAQGHEDHPHPQLGRAIGTRLIFLPLAAAVPAGTVAIDIGIAVRVRILVEAALPRADPADVSELRSRAPPLG
jgi:hypothetical protein